MIRLRFPRDVSAPIRKARTVLVVGSGKHLGKAATWKPMLGEALAKATGQLAAVTTAGDLGKVGSSLQADGRRLLVGVIPDAGSRYNSPARAESVRRSAKGLVDHAGPCVILACVERPDHLAATANAVAKALPLFSAKTGRSKVLDVDFAAVDPRGHRIVPPKEVELTARMTREAARLVDTPPTDLDPDGFAREARKILREIAGVTVREIKGDALLRSGLRGVHAVGRAARSAPRVVVATVGSRGTARHVALVGKGITYDTGGLHLKARGAMEGMKGDMGGAAATLGAFRVLAAAKPRYRLSLVLCMAENAVAAASYKPDDILTMHSGKTVEINNTDAEGRLLLADGASYAARRLGADVILDAATLTGAQMIATGLMHAAVVSNDAALEAAAVTAGLRSGDLCHPLPFAPEFYKQEFKSPVADMRNSVANRSNAQSSCAAQFVWWHIEDQPVRWLHVDLAGPASLDDRGTGFGVALLSELVRNLP